MHSQALRTRNNPRLAVFEGTAVGRAAHTGFGRAAAATAVHDGDVARAFVRDARRLQVDGALLWQDVKAWAARGRVGAGSRQKRSSCARAHRPCSRRGGSMGPAGRWRRESAAGASVCSRCVVGHSRPQTRTRGAEGEERGRPRGGRP
eukprot:5024047-Prymnesium_polylepis.1